MGEQIAIVDISSATSSILAFNYYFEQMSSSSVASSIREEIIQQ